MWMKPRWIWIPPNPNPLLSGGSTLLTALSLSKGEGTKVRGKLNLKKI